MLQRFLCGFTFLFAFSLPVLAGECTASSGPHRIALLELYTSEGCSSCPPADRWLSSLAAQGFTPDRVVPLALHVDYWDYIGWQDRFAQPAFSARQRDMVRLAGARTVYTPQVMLNGRDFRGLKQGDLAKRLATINQSPAHASIQLRISRQTPERIDTSVSVSAEHPENLVLYLALYENGLSTEVKAGENSGVKLHHDYVVREWYGPMKVGTAVRQTLRLKPEWQAAKTGVVAFVQNRDSGEVVQAVSLGMCS